MKKLLFFALALIFSFFNATSFSQNFEWAVKLGNTGNDEEGKSVITDGSGNVYTTGFFEGMVDFDPGFGTYNLTSPGFTADAYISKLDANGNFVWAKQIGSTSNDFGRSIALDASGNIYITGDFQGTVDFDPGPGTSNLISNGATDIFILKLDSSGNFIWAKSVGGTSGDIGNSIFIDALDNIYCTGVFTSSVDFDPGVGMNTLTSSTSAFDVFVLKLNSTGDFVWAKKMGGGGDDRGMSIFVDANGNVFTAGYSLGGDFDPGLLTFNLTTAGNSDVFVSKLDPLGNFVWAKMMGGTGFDYCYSLALSSSGNVYITGSFEGTADFDPGVSVSNLATAGSSDIFISKLDNNGNFVWANRIGNTGADRGNSIFIDANEDVYSTGSFAGTVDFEPGAGTTNLSSGGAFGMFVLKLNASGSFVSAKRIGGTGSAFGNSIFLDSSFNLFTTGYFGGTVDFNPDAGVNNLTTSTGWDAFVQKFSQCIPTSSMQTISTCNSYTWSANGTNYTTSGVYTATLANAAGCDSTATLNLTINNSSAGSANVITCDSYTWSANGTNYTTSGVYTVTLTNATGCDSIATLNLTINNSSAGSANITTCDSYTWSANGTNYSTSGVYTATLTNAAGCDSIVTLNLTINPNFNQSENISICNNATYTLPNGSVVNISGTYYSNLTSVNGCDSIIETVLSVITPNIATSLSGITITANAFTANYQWLDCNSNFLMIPGENASSFTPSVNGSYAVEIFENGCVDTSDCVLIENVNLNELEYDWFEIYPNPTTSSVTLFSKNGIGSMLIIQDPQGKIVDRIQINSPSTIIDLTKYHKGTYLMLIENKGVFKKLIVQ